MKAVVAGFNQEKTPVGAFSVITNLRMEIFEALTSTAQGLCALLGIMDREVCHGGIANYAPIIEYIIANK